MLLLHLKQPEQIILDSYYNKKLEEYKNDLVSRYVNKQGQNITDILRGFIIALEMVTKMKSGLEEHTKIQEEVSKGGN
jgi:hypothetical protein